MTPTQALIAAIERDFDGVTVVWCPDLGRRDGLVAEVAGLAGSTAAPFRTASVNEAVKAPHRMALLVPNDEQAAVQELEGRCDQLLADPVRTQPVVLFLLRDGDGRIALAKALSLSSWIRGGRDVDPDRCAEVDAPVERARFQDETATRVEDWLVAWRAGQIIRNGETLALSYWAALLEQP